MLGQPPSVAAIRANPGSKSGTTGGPGMQVPVNAAARLDRLPMGPFHWRVLRLGALGMFFATLDNSMAAGILAALLQSGWSTLALNADFISVTFVGLSIGAVLAGVLGDRFG